jgi:hypothetical protein
MSESDGLSDKILTDLKEFQAWRRSKGDFDLLDYASCIATPDSFFAFHALFAPTLVLHEGFYFLASHFKASLYVDWMQQLRDPIAVQKVMNHIHIATIFQQQYISDHVAVEAATRLAECWSQLFANKGLVAKAFGSNLHDAEVTLFKEL